MFACPSSCPVKPPRLLQRRAASTGRQATPAAAVNAWRAGSSGQASASGGDDSRSATASTSRSSRQLSTSRTRSESSPARPPSSSQQAWFMRPIGPPKVPDSPFLRKGRLAKDSRPSFSAAVLQPVKKTLQNNVHWRTRAGQAPLPARLGSLGEPQNGLPEGYVSPVWATKTDKTTSIPARPKRPPESAGPAQDDGRSKGIGRSEQGEPPEDEWRSEEVERSKGAELPEAFKLPSTPRPPPPPKPSAVLRERKPRHVAAPSTTPRGPNAPSAPEPTQKLIRAEAERLLKERVIPRLRKQYEADVAELSSSLSNELLRDMHALAAGQLSAARMPNLAPNQDPPELLLNLVRAISGPRDMANAMEILRESHQKGWHTHPDMAVAVAECFPPDVAIRMLRDVDQYGVGIPPLARLRVLRTLLRNLFAGDDPLGLKPPPLTYDRLSFFRMLARNQHLEDPFMTALMFNAFAKLKGALPEQRTLADVEKSLGEMSVKWAACPLSVEEAHATIVLVDNIRDRFEEAAEHFDTLPLLHVHRHRERLLALYQRSLPPDAAIQEARMQKELFQLPWASSLAINRLSSRTVRKTATDGETMTSPKLRRWLRPAFNFHSDDPVILMLALQLASRLPDAARREAETAVILERLDDVDVAKGSWRLAHEDDERPGAARALARQTIELGLAQLSPVLGDRVRLWEELLQ